MVLTLGRGKLSGEEMVTAVAERVAVTMAFSFFL